MSKRPWLLLPGLLLALSLSATACGGDDKAGAKDKATKDDPEADEYVDALAASIAESDNGFDDDETNECVAQAIVEAIGVDDLQDKATPDEFAGADSLEELDLTIEGDDVWDAGNDCTDLGRWLMEGTAGGDEDTTDCLMDATTDDERKALFVAGMEGSNLIDPEVQEAIQKAIDDCLTPETSG